VLRHSVSMASAAELAARGPLVDMALRQDPGAATGPILHGVARVTMMIDTGATRTLVDERIPESLGLKSDRYESIVGISGNAELRPVYPMVVQLHLVDRAARPYVVEFRKQIISFNPALDDYHGHGLLGRDVLSHFRLDYDGVGGAFSLIDEHSPARPEHVKSDEEARRIQDEARRAEKRRRKAERRARRRGG
jgi:hypothetical protein